MVHVNSYISIYILYYEIHKIPDILIKIPDILIHKSPFILFLFVPLMY